MKPRSARGRYVRVGLSIALVMASMGNRRRSILLVEKYGPNNNKKNGMPRLSEGASDSNKVPTIERGSGSCGCHRTRANATCCQRAVLRAHKFGFLITQKLFRPFEPFVQRLPIHPLSLPDDPSLDYRHAVIVRDYVEAFVSGYLYHKSGRECWLTFNGWKRPKSWGEKNEDWDPYMKRSAFDIGPYPPRANRSICRYLADESEEVGMKVYVAATLAWHYDGVYTYLQQAKERQERGEKPRTLLVCLDDASDAVGEKRVFHQMMDWLFPGGHKRRFPDDASSPGPNHGGHATSRDPDLRRRLMALVQRYDRELFNGTLALTNSLIGCNATMQQRR